MEKRKLATYEIGKTERGRGVGGHQELGVGLAAAEMAVRYSNADVEQYVTLEVLKREMEKDGLFSWLLCWKVISAGGRCLARGPA